jgi:hypothetical protein
MTGKPYEEWTLADFKEKNRRLCELVIRYGAHTESCMLSIADRDPGYRPSDLRCTCGLDVMLAGAWPGGTPPRGGARLPAPEPEGLSEREPLLLAAARYRDARARLLAVLGAVRKLAAVVPEHPRRLADRLDGRPLCLLLVDEALWDEFTAAAALLDSPYDDAG